MVKKKKEKKKKEFISPHQKLNLLHRKHFLSSISFCDKVFHYEMIVMVSNKVFSNPLQEKLKVIMLLDFIPFKIYFTVFCLFVCF